MGRKKDIRPVKRRADENPAATLPALTPQESKRRRLQAAAIAALEAIPQEDVENAAALATRSTIEAWPELSTRSDKSLSEENSGSATTGVLLKEFPCWLRGLGCSTTLDENHFSTLKQLHDLVKKNAPAMSSWSGSTEDPRRRAFGFLPGTLGCRLVVVPKNSPN